MELKPIEIIIAVTILLFLLIVPYGIETVYLCHGWFLPACLLIVPYGIETRSTLLFFGFAFLSFNRTLWN